MASEVVSKVVSKLPSHLQCYLARQDYDLYTAIDHASWRFIMRISVDFFKKHAHPIYLKGLAETGITIDRIPRITEMSEKLSQFGWSAVPITGFIPPAPFLEMLSLRIMPIACDMRKLENIDYTPSPDIVHEAAGHAPIIADQAYQAYLKKFGEIARYVIFAKEDLALYEAVLNLSEIKEDPHSTEQKIAQAQHLLDEAVKNIPYVSEAQKLTRLGWWTTEYGLIEQSNEYKIYGAGLLSSVGESYFCLKSSVPKIPLTIKCTETDYDITKPQPQLFVTDDFKKLEGVIDQLAEQMSYKRGGEYGLTVARRAQTVTTVELENNLQVSGILQDFKLDKNGGLTFFKFSGPCQISKNFKELEGHSAKTHHHGFSSPLGCCDQIQNFKTWKVGQTLTLLYESGFKVFGVLEKCLVLNESPAIITFSDCTVSFEDQIYFDPSWGQFDLIVGSKAKSVFGGAADRSAFMMSTQAPTFKPRSQKNNRTSENNELIKLYEKVALLNSQNQSTEQVLLKITEVLTALDKDFSEDWLLRLQILEMLHEKKIKSELCEQLENKLNQIKKTSEKLEMLIQRGLQLFNTKVH
jgi:phenylalanine-4-hydroxylase